MNRNQLINAIAGETGYTQVGIASVFDAFERLVTDEIKAGRTVLLTGFVKFEPKDLPARTRRNPQTGEPVVMQPSRSVKVRAMANLKRDVR